MPTLSSAPTPTDHPTIATTLHRPQQLYQGVTAVLSLAVVPEAEEAVAEE